MSKNYLYLYLIDGLDLLSFCFTFGTQNAKSAAVANSESPIIRLK